MSFGSGTSVSIKGVGLDAGQEWSCIEVSKHGIVPNAPAAAAPHAPPLPLPLSLCAAVPGAGCEGPHRQRTPHVGPARRCLRLQRRQPLLGHQGPNQEGRQVLCKCSAPCCPASKCSCLASCAATFWPLDRAIQQGCQPTPAAGLRVGVGGRATAVVADESRVVDGRRNPADATRFAFAGTLAWQAYIQPRGASPGWLRLQRHSLAWAPGLQGLPRPCAQRPLLAAPAHPALPAEGLVLRGKAVYAQPVVDMRMVCGKAYLEQVGGRRLLAAAPAGGGQGEPGRKGGRPATAPSPTGASCRGQAAPAAVLSRRCRPACSLVPRQAAAPTEFRVKAELAQEEGAGGGLVGCLPPSRSCRPCCRPAVHGSAGSIVASMAGAGRGTMHPAAAPMPAGLPPHAAPAVGVQVRRVAGTTIRGASYARLRSRPW